MFFVYIIWSKSKNQFYTGFTDNINRRLKQHNQRLSNTLTTKYTHDFQLTFCQLVKTSSSARKLEKYIKSGFGRELRDEIFDNIKQSLGL